MSDLRSELLDIYQRLGHVNPRAAVAEVEAGGPDAYPSIHSRLEWDDVIAGAEYRVIQMRQLIKSVKVAYKDPENPARQGDTRGFWAIPVHDSVGAADESGYAWQPVDEVINNPIAEKILMRELQREIKRLRDRYSHLKEYAEIMRQESEALAAD